MMRLVPVSLVLLICLVAPAEAGPVAGFIAAAFKAITLKSIALAALKAAVAVGASLLAQRRAQKRQRQPGLQTTFTTKGGTDPQGTVIGWYATAGHRVYQNSTGPNNVVLHEVIELGDMPGVNLRRVVIDGQVSELGPVDPERGSRPVLAKHKNGNYHTNIWFYDGTQTAADERLVGQYAGRSKRQWTEDHILTGTPYVVARHYFNREVYRNGVPDMRFELDGIPFYDPRQDSSVGGDGAQRWADKTTWAGTTNAVVLIYNIMRGLRTPTGELWGGGCDPDDLPLENWIAGMNVCDLGVGPNSRPQFQAGFEFRFEEEPASVVEELLAACNGQICELGGVWTIQVGAPATSSVHISDGDLLVSEPEEYDPFPGLEATHNAISVSHPSPDGLWNATASQPITNDEWEAEDGVQRLFELRLPAVPWAEQSAQVADNYISDERRFRTHKIVLPSEYSWLRPLMTITWSSEWNDYDSKLFEITDAAYDPRALNVALTLRERDPSDFGYVEELDLPGSPQETSVIEVVDAGVPGFDVESYVVRDGDNKERTPGILISWDETISDTVQTLAFEVRVKTQTDLAWSGTYGDVEAGRFILAPLLRDTIYEVRARAIASTRDTYWTIWAEVTTPDVGLDPDDLSTAIWEAISDSTETITELAIDEFEADVFTPQMDAFETNFVAIGLNIERVERALELQQIDQVTAAEAIGVINDRILWLLTNASETTSRIADAGIYVDQSDGKVRIVAVEQVAQQVNETEIRLDAAEASISLRATQAWVNQQISEAVLDPSQIPVVHDLEARISQAEINIDANESLIALKADLTVIDGFDLRLTQAELDIDAAEASIDLKASQTDFSALETRVQTAETEISAIDGPLIRQTVADTRMLQSAAEISGTTDLRTLLRNYEQRKALRVDVAYAQTELRALVDANRVSTASRLDALGAAIDDNQVLIESEASARADETSVLGQQIVAIDSRLGIAESDVTGNAGAIATLEGRVQQSENDITSQAQSITDLTADLDLAESDLSAQASALSSLQARVTAAEDGVTVQSQDVTQLSSDLTDAEDEIALQSAAISSLATRVTENEAGLSTQSDAIIDLESGLEAAEGNISGQSAALAVLTTRVNDNEGALDVQSAQIVDLQSDLETAEGDITAQSEAVATLATRVTDNEDAIEAQTQDIVQLQSDLSSTESDVNSTAAAVSSLTTRVTDAESSITSQSQQLTTLDADLSDLETGQAAQSTALGGLTARVTDAENALTAQTQDITDLGSALTDAEGNITTQASALAALTSRVDSTESGLTSQSQDITDLENSLDAAEDDIAAQSSALSGLESRVTNAEGIVTSQSQDITDLQSGLSDVEGDVTGQATAIDSLETSVSTAEGQIASQASSITSLQSTVGSHAASISQNITVIDGIQAEYTLAIDNNGVVSGMKLRTDLDDNQVPATVATFIADKFAVQGPGANPTVPFVVYTTETEVGGVPIPAGVYLEKAFIRKASVDTLEIAGNAITVPLRVYSPGDNNEFEVTSSVPVDLVELTIDRLAGLATDITFSANWVGLTGQLASPQLRLMRSADGGSTWSQVRVYSLGVGDNSGFELGSLNTVDFDESGGEVTYKWTAEVPPAANAVKGHFRVFRIYMAVTQFKR